MLPLFKSDILKNVFKNFRVVAGLRDRRDERVKIKATAFSPLSGPHSFGKQRDVTKSSMWVFINKLCKDLCNICMIIIVFLCSYKHYKHTQLEEMYTIL